MRALIFLVLSGLSVILSGAGPGFAAALDVVRPVASCASLTGTDMVAIGGAGSEITAAEETTSDGIAVCSVTGTLAPEVNFQVLLPMERWTQR